MQNTNAEKLLTANRQGQLHIYSKSYMIASCSLAGPSLMDTTIYSVFLQLMVSFSSCFPCLKPNRLLFI